MKKIKSIYAVAVRKRLASMLRYERDIEKFLEAYPDNQFALIFRESSDSIEGMRIALDEIEDIDNPNLPDEVFEFRINTEHPAHEATVTHPDWPAWCEFLDRHEKKESKRSA